MSPTKQARGDSGKERKLHRWQNGEKTLGETRLSRGASSPPARRISSLFQLQQSQSVSGPLVPGVFPRWMSRWRGSHWRSVSGAHLCVLDSADGQGCRGCLQVLILHLCVRKCQKKAYLRIWMYGSCPKQATVNKLTMTKYTLRDIRTHFNFNSWIFVVQMNFAMQ